MNEPTILDYVKSIFKNLDTFRDFLRAVFEKRHTTQMNQFLESSDTQHVVTETEVVVLVTAPQTQRAFPKLPWVTLGVLFLALIGQMQFEPPRDTYLIGIFFYITALGIAIYAFVRGQWNIPQLPADEIRKDSFIIYGLPFVVSLLLGVLTFYYMSDNLFTRFNVILWVLTFVFHLLAFWIPEHGQLRPRFNIIEFLSRSEWKIHVKRQSLLILAVFAIAAFFAFYKLYDLPGDMTSDHAEKLLDVYDITQGQYSIFFPRNTGREPLQFYFVALIAQWLGVSFLSLKTSTALMGMLTMVYIYFLGKELGGERVALLAVTFAGIGVWPVLIDRIGLRFAYYPPFTAATLYYFIRGLRLQRRNEFILAGIALGIGLNGYTPMRIVPFALIVFFIVYFFHVKDVQTRKQVLVWFGLLAFTAWVFIIPLARYAVDFPEQFEQRAFSRVGTIERPIPGPILQIFAQNVWAGLKVFNWNGGSIWTFTIPGRPAMDVISSALFLIGVVLLIFRYIRSRNWQDMMLLFAIPLLQLPSTLSLAFPDENPALNRMSAAFVPGFLIVAIAIDTIVNGFIDKSNNEEQDKEHSSLGVRSVFAFILVLGLVVASLFNNYNLIFKVFPEQYKTSNWNTRDMGLLMKGFSAKGGSPDQAWIIPYPYWADTRLPLFWAETVYRGESSIAPERLPDTVVAPGAKLFIVNLEDQATLQTLKKLYPQGVVTIYQAEIPSKNFYVFRVSGN